MPRIRRRLSESKIYHVMARGLNKQLLFCDDKDRLNYLKFIKEAKEKFAFKIYAYCIMNNHIHLLIRDYKDAISNIMKFINMNYAISFNKKYQRIGYVFNNRFLSECIENKEYLFTCIRYIHRNPVNAEYAKTIYDYKFSSIHAYKSEKGNYLQLVDVNAIYKKFSRQEFLNYNESANKDRCLDISFGKLIDDDAKKLYDEYFGEVAKTKNTKMHKNITNSYCDLNNEIVIETVKKLLKENINLKQISRVSGLSYYQVRKLKGE